MRSIFPAIIFISFFACKKKTDLVQYKDGHQLLTVNDLNTDGSKAQIPKIGIISPDSIVAGDELVVKIFLKDSNLKIADAFVGCENVSAQAVDTTTYKVSGCSTGLVVQNDTIFIGFRPSKLGLNEFQEITILTRDNDMVFRTIKYSFTYRVVD